MSIRLAADIGGTFTDLVLIDEKGDLFIQKTSSTPGDFKEGVLVGVDKILNTTNEVRSGNPIEVKDLEYFVHGATVVLNAILERKLPDAALVTTKGFRDVLEIMRTNNPRMYDLMWVKPKPLVPRKHRFEVEERMLYTGEAYKDLDEKDARILAKKLKNIGINAIAVCFMHFYANPDHERRFREILLEEHPDATVIISSDVASEIREFERTSTTVINASTVPIITSYLNDLNDNLQNRGLKRELLVMQSNGGVITATTARSLPVRTVMSGPSGGVVGAQFTANQIDESNVITIDMGGTSSDLGLISDGLARTVDESEVDGWPIMVPMIEILAIGAGGGSIAWIDTGGALPGPVCYRRGGTEPTVSDTCAVLRRLNPDYFLGGEMSLDVNGAEQAIKEKIAEPLGMSVLEAAEGIIKVVSANMNKAIRSILIARGYDPREFTVMAFGGGGGMVAGNLLKAGDSNKVIVPNNPGAICALGMLTTDLRHDMSQTNVQEFSDVDWTKIKKIFEQLGQRGVNKLIEEGVKKTDVEIEYAIGVRYVGQDYYLRVYTGIDTMTPEAINVTYNKMHEKLYGFANPEFEMEW